MSESPASASVVWQMTWFAQSQPIINGSWSPCPPGRVRWFCGRAAFAGWVRAGRIHVGWIRAGGSDGFAPALVRHQRTRSCVTLFAFTDYFRFQWSCFFLWPQPQELCGCQCCQPQCSTSTWQEHFFFFSSLITMLLLCFFPPLESTTASSLITMFSLFSFLPASTLIASRATTSARYLRSISRVCGLRMAAVGKARVRGLIASSEWLEKQIRAVDSTELKSKNRKPSHNWSGAL